MRETLRQLKGWWRHGWHCAALQALIMVQFAAAFDKSSETITGHNFHFKHSLSEKEHNLPWWRFAEEFAAVGRICPCLRVAPESV